MDERTIEYMGVAVTIDINRETGEPTIIVNTDERDNPTKRGIPDVAIYLNDAILYDGQADAIFKERA